MQSSTPPPPIPPPVPGIGRVLVACFVPAVTLLASAFLGAHSDKPSPLVLAVIGLGFAVPAWAAWDLHKKRRALGKNILPNAWLAAGAGVLAGVVFCVGALVLALLVFLLVLFGVCALQGGRIGG